MNSILNKNLFSKNQEKQKKEYWDLVKIPMEAVETCNSGKAHKIFLDNTHHTFIGVGKLVLKNNEVYVKIFKENKYPFKVFKGKDQIGEIPLELSTELFKNIKKV